ncbi:C1 family peptidase [Streptomyces sp. B8F3]|uniref:C1 family peptidase n=1 Tax=Streptomyces sp. B8F3 TaxID=3153573 RepID=UPI00325E58A1
MVERPDPENSEPSAKGEEPAPPPGDKPSTPDQTDTPEPASPSAEHQPGMLVPPPGVTLDKPLAVAPAGQAIRYPQLGPADLPAATPLPAMVPDPFDPSATIDLTAAPPPNFNLVDGTVAIATDPQMPFVLFKGHNPNTWFYAPRWGRIAKNPNGEPAFLVTKKVRNNPDGSKTTLGGILSFMVELVVELPGEGQRQQWTNLIKTLYNINPTGGAFTFQPLRLSPGKMDVFGLDMYAKPGQQLKGVEVGSSSSIGFAIELTPDGADHFAAMLGASPAPYPPQVAIMFTYRYQYLIPQCQIKATGFKKKAYDYFSWNAKARASYFGLVNGSFDYQRVRADLRQQHALDVSVIGQPPTGVDLTKLLDAIFDQYVKLEVGQWIQPDPKPVEASAPGGFFGGVSVAMKSVSLSDTAQFDQTLTFTGIGENIHQVSFNFEQQLGAFDPRKHLFVEEDDIKLPFKVLLSNSSMVKRMVPSASYTTPTGPRMVHCPAVSGEEGGETSGIIQYTPPHAPTSAQLEVLVDFKPPHVGYKYRETLPISDTGAGFAFYPEVWVQRTQLIFTDAAYVADPNSKALFKWEWTPPTRPNEPPRPKMAGHTLVSVDAGGNVSNLPTHDILFPFHPNDWTGESTPKVQYKLQGLTGDWRGKNASGTISLFETAMSVGFDGAVALGEPAIPAGLLEATLRDPAYRQRLTATYGTPPHPTAPTPAQGSGAGTAPGSGFVLPSQPGQPGQPPAPGQSAAGPATRAPYPLGFTPDLQHGELSLWGRELKAQASYTHAQSANLAMGAPTAVAGNFDFRNINGYNYISPVKAQGNCGSCVSFGATAAVEGALKRYHPDRNPDFSEAHLFFCHARAEGRTCGNYGESNGGWWPERALAWWRDVGVVDEGCFPYVGPATTSHPTPGCTKCGDAAGRLTRIDNYYALNNAQQMKSWLSVGQYSPLVTGFTVYQDFFDFFAANTQPSAVYRVSSSPGTNWGGHCVCVIGYSDDERAWICKNSWGPHWGASGFFKIGYGQAGIDYQMFGVGVH